MQVNWLVKKNNPHLLIIALGWGASTEVVGNQILPNNTDVVTLRDYSDLRFDAVDLPLENYSEKSLVAWSFGVWASEQLFANQSFTTAIALCGTPYPISRDYGIDPRVFALTLHAVLNDGVVKFVARMCGKHLREYLQNHSTRALSDIQEELQILNDVAVKPYTPSIRWTGAIIAEKDIIFPVKSVVNYWKSTTTPIIYLPETPHYPFYTNDFLICTIKS